MRDRLLIALGAAVLHGTLHAARLLSAPQGWTWTELAPAWGLEVALAGLLFAVVAAALARIERTPTVLACGLIVVTLVAVAPGLDRSKPEAPVTAPASAAGARTVVLLTLDTLRRDHVSAYPDALVPQLTPHLEALAREGVRFDDAVTTAPLTLPSHTTLLTGVTPDRHRVVRNGRVLPAGLDNAPRRLAGAGYATGAFVSTSVLHGSHGLARFFDVYRDELGSRPGRRLLPLARFVPAPDKQTRLVKEPGARTVARAATWLGQQGEAPVFLWVHLYDAHTPHGERGLVQEAAELPDPCAYVGHPTDFRGGPRALIPPPGAAALPCGDGARGRASALASGYAREVGYVDSLVGELQARLTELGRWEQTALIVAADHGESLSEHHQMGSHEHSLYEPVARVPLIVRVPGGRPAVVPDQVSTVRVAATLLRLAGLEPGEAMAGPDLLTMAAPGPAVIVGPSPLGRLAGNHRTAGSGIQIAVRMPPTKTLIDGGGYLERYDLSVDPSEQRPVWLARDREAADRLHLRARGPIAPPGLPAPPGTRRAPVRQPVHPDVPDPDVVPWTVPDATARRLLTAWAEGTATAEPASLPPEVLEALRSLGYTDL
ncbi:MAG: sulfatase [Proteobacteria bacterium]|nr:sulfatase [Pseudomonadota bacterium]